MVNDIAKFAFHILLLLPLLPQPTMAMKQGAGLRKGDAHGVPGKTMLNGDRPVPLPPGVNLAPKVQSILNTESSGNKKKVASLLAGPTGGNKGNNKLVESLLGPSSSSSKTTGNNKLVESLLAPLSKATGNATDIGGKRVNSLLMDPSVNAINAAAINKGGAAATEYMAMPKNLFEKMAESIKDIFEEQKYVPAARNEDHHWAPPLPPTTSNNNKKINLADIADAPIVATFLFAISKFLQQRRIDPDKPFKSPTLNLELVMDHESRQLFETILAETNVDGRIRAMVSDIFERRVTEQPRPALQSRLTCHWLTFMLQELIKGLNKNGGGTVEGKLSHSSGIKFNMDIVRQRMDDVNEDNSKHLKNDEKKAIKTAFIKIKKDMTKTMIMDDDDNVDVVEGSGATAAQGNKKDTRRVRFASSLLMGQEEQVQNAPKGKLAESLLSQGSGASGKGRGMDAWVAEKTRKMKEKPMMDNF